MMLFIAEFPADGAEYFVCPGHKLCKQCVCPGVQCGGAGAGEPIPFEEAFDQLRHCYMENERTNRVRHESGYQRVVQITIIGRGAGTFTIRFNENGMQVEPTSASDAEAYVHCSFDNLLAMARGLVTVDKLYLSGQLRLSGNLSKGFEIRYLLSPAKQRA